MPGGAHLVQNIVLNARNQAYGTQCKPVFEQLITTTKNACTSTPF